MGEEKEAKVRLPASMSKEVGEKVTTTPILVVGAGGIGCELLKNLVLTGFKNITIIDLDTIDVTNLNRQFLFHRRHVGMSKSKVARESALSFVPDADITALHGSITTSEYGVSFYKKFTMVLNALDNRAARSHVNRMCLAADVPLVESGTAGYFGQVTVHRKAISECYDCVPKPHQKSFPGCTIRNTPSEPIHCIVWSKHLFNQLFGEADPDEDVSPDTEDPELAAGKDDDDKKAEEAGDKDAAAAATSGDGNVKRVNTRQWAIDNQHDPKTIFQKLFHDDIKYLLSMEKLWAKRTPPVPLDWDKLKQEGGGKAAEASEGGIRDQAQWTLEQCADVFASAVAKLSGQLKASDYKDHLVWDKDDDAAMDFVAACANIRSYVFHIAQKTRFDIKSMAGNIIPAIATTNAIIAGCIVMEALKILRGQADQCKMVFIARKPNPRHKLLVPGELSKPDPKCYVCAMKPEVNVRLDLAKVTKKTLEDKILKGALNMVAPDAEIDGKGVVLIDSEAAGASGDEANDNKPLKEFGLADGSVLSCDDFLQDYNVKLFLYQTEDLADGVEFELVGDIAKLKEQQKEKAAAESAPAAPADAPASAPASAPNEEEKSGDKNGEENGTKNGNGVHATTSDAAAEKKEEVKKVDDDDDDDIEEIAVVVRDSDDVIAIEEEAPAAKKRRQADNSAIGDEPPKNKKMRTEDKKDEEEEDGIVCLD